MSMPGVRSMVCEPVRNPVAARPAAISNNLGSGQRAARGECKREDAMLVETTIEALSKQAQLFDKASSFRGRPRERIVALSEAEELFFRLHPYHYRAMQVIRVASQLGKSVARRRDVLRKCESRLISLLTKTITDAIGVGDLRLAGSWRAGELAFVLWALAFGTRALMDTSVATAQLGVRDGFRASRDAANALLDALNWQPLSTHWDYEQTRERIRAELFAGEWRRLTVL
jgi:hypothetical protein